MKITRKREIILERTRSVTIRFGDESGEIFCPVCEELIRFITVDQAATISEMTAREIFRLVEDERIHFQETKQGRLLVCLASLINPPENDGHFLSKAAHKNKDPE